MKQKFLQLLVGCAIIGAFFSAPQAAQAVDICICNVEVRGAGSCQATDLPPVDIQYNDRGRLSETNSYLYEKNFGGDEGVQDVFDIHAFLKNWIQYDITELSPECRPFHESEQTVSSYQDDDINDTLYFVSKENCPGQQGSGPVNFTELGIEKGNQQQYWYVSFSCSLTQEGGVTKLSSVAGLNPLKADSITGLIGLGIRTAMGIIGSIALLMVAFGGLMFMTAAGNGDRAKKGVTTMLWAGLGVIVMLSSYIIITYILEAL